MSYLENIAWTPSRIMTSEGGLPPRFQSNTSSFISFRFNISGPDGGVGTGVPPTVFAGTSCDAAGLVAGVTAPGPAGGLTLTAVSTMETVFEGNSNDVISNDALSSFSNNANHSANAMRSFRPRNYHNSMVLGLFIVRKDQLVLPYCQDHLPQQLIRLSLVQAFSSQHFEHLKQL